MAHDDFSAGAANIGMVSVPPCAAALNWTEVADSSQRETNGPIVPRVDDAYGPVIAPFDALSKVVAVDDVRSTAARRHA
jgi:hypothetical protein